VIKRFLHANPKAKQIDVQKPDMKNPKVICNSRQIVMSVLGLILSTNSAPIMEPGTLNRLITTFLNKDRQSGQFLVLRSSRWNELILPS
jgi:hypothetical protein